MLCPVCDSEVIEGSNDELGPDIQQAYVWCPKCKFEIFGDKGTIRIFKLDTERKRDGK